MKSRPNVTIYGEGYIHDSATIGVNTKIGTGHDIGENVVIGRGVNIQCHVAISNGVIIGDGTFIAPGVKILNDKYMNGLITPPTIGNYCRIGGGAIILPDVTIGDNCFIGAGVKVTKKLPSGSIVLK